jgi:DUF4097 and DUF4098 domain-containing protein YvlB
MMKKLLISALVSLLATTVSAEDVDRTIDAAADGHVEVSNISGAITVQGWKRDAVKVTGTLGRNVKELILERDGDRILVKVKVPHNSGRDIDSDLHISVPMKSNLDVGTVSADIDVSDVAGEQSLHTVSGDITTDYSGEDVQAESVSGDVEVTGNGVDGEIYATTVSGDVTLFRVGGEVKAEAVTGDVTVDEGSFSRARLETVNGEVTFHAELRKGGRLDIDSVNGDVDVEFDGEVSGRFDIETFNGKIRNCFGPKAERTSKYTPGLELSFTEGNDSGRTKISTLNGNVSICK